MPTYQYKREDGSIFEIVQKISEDALRTCPETGQKVKRVITGGGGVVYKGTGWYVTDYKNKSNGEANGSSNSESNGSSNSEANGSSNSEANGSSNRSTNETGAAKKDSVQNAADTGSTAPSGSRSGENAT